MKIHNVRLGLATNSSSSHSIVILPRNHGKENDDDMGGEYGWQAFTLSSEKTKKDYMAHTLYNNLESSVGKSIAQVVVKSMYGDDFNFDGYIDHQSVLTLPTEWDGTGIDMEFFKEFQDYILRNNIAILGGNDNGGEHPMAGLPSAIGHFPTESSSSDFIARKDGSVWVLFNRRSGTKIRMDFSQELAA